MSFRIQDEDLDPPCDQPPIPGWMVAFCFAGVGASLLLIWEIAFR